MNKIIEIKFGSHLYGTDTPESDLDIKAIYLPEARDIVLGRVKETIVHSRSKAECERNTKDDVDIETFSLCRFLKLLTEGQTTALDFLFGWKCKGSTFSTPEGEKIMSTIYENREKLLTRNVTAFVGYARAQASKYGIKGSRMDALKRAARVLDEAYATDPHRKLKDFADKLYSLVTECNELVSLEKAPLVELTMLKGPSGNTDQPFLHINGRFIPLHATGKFAHDVVHHMLDNYGQRAAKAHLAGGIDWKALHHAVRVNEEALELLRTSEITFPLRNRELHLAIKKGELPYEKVAGMIEQGLVDLTEAHGVSKLRDVPDQEWADKFLYGIYGRIVWEDQE